MHIVPMQEQVLALFVTLSASSFLSASIVSKFETRFAQGHVPELHFYFWTVLEHSLMSDTEESQIVHRCKERKLNV